MSRSRGRVTRRDFRGRRVNLYNANLRLPLPDFGPIASVYPLTLSEDRRVWHPLRAYRPAANVHGAQHQLQVSSPARVYSGVVPVGVSFRGSQKVLVCIRRKIRRQVMHALGVAGSVGLRRPRRNWTSEIHCEG